MTTQLEKSIALAVEKHQAQIDKAGKPYILHPLRVMMQFNDETLQCIAVMHDIVEDTDLTLAELINLGFSDDIVTAIDHLTRKPHEDYSTFIERAAINPLAKLVKIADLKDNLDIDRLDTITEKDTQRINKYKRSLKQLMQ